MNVIHNEDCLDTMKRMEDESIDLLLTDIPYGQVNRKSGGLRNLDKKDADVFDMDMDNLISELIRVTKGSIYVFCSTEQVSEIRQLMVEKGLTTRLVIWEKTNPSPMNGQHIWLSSVETCVFGRKKGATFNEHCKSSVIRNPNGRGKMHPTEKPLKLFSYLVSVSSKEGDLVYDPFIGSGTTAVACQELNRNYIGSEINKEYCEMAEIRLSQGVLL